MKVFAQTMRKKGGGILMQKEIDYRQLGIRVKEIRQNRGITQDSLAAMINCNVSHISNIENCHTKASLNTLLSIANALDVSVDSILSGQYKNESCAIDTAIFRALQKCDNKTKERVLRIIEILQ